MAGFNPTKAYAKNAQKTDSAQSRIADLQAENQRAVLGDPTARDQDAIRHDLFKMSALLGFIRENASYLIQELKQNLEASKGLNELAKA